MENENRRGFFIGAIYGLWGLITATLAIPAGLYLLVPPKPHKGEDSAEARIDKLRCAILVGGWVDRGLDVEFQQGRAIDFVERNSHGYLPALMQPTRRRAG